MEEPQEEQLAFSLIAQGICKNLFRISNDFLMESVNLRKELIKSGVISEEETYDMVVANTKLRSALVQYLGLGLPTEPILSRYGREFGISDYDIYFHCNTASKASAYIGRIMPDKSFSEVSQILDSLAKQKKKIQQYLYRIRDQVIANMGLPETPDFELIKREKSSEKKKKQEEAMTTAEELRSIVTNKLFNATHSSKKNTGDDSFMDERALAEPDADELDAEPMVEHDAETMGEHDAEPVAKLLDELGPDRVDEHIDSDGKTHKVYIFRPKMPATEPVVAEPVAAEPDYVDDDETETLESDKYDSDGKDNIDDLFGPDDNSNESIQQKNAGGGKWGNRSMEPDEQQLYETCECDVLDLLEYLKGRLPKKFGRRVFEPCYGNGAIAKVVEKHGYTVTVARDKYTLEESHDFLTEDYPDRNSYDLIITNTPFKDKARFFEQLQLSCKPFCAIFPCDLIGALANKWRNGYKILVPKKVMMFEHDGRKSGYGGHCFWFLGNFYEEWLNTDHTYTIEYLK